MINLFRRLAILTIAGVALAAISPQHAKAQGAGFDASVILTALEQGADDTKIQELVNAALAQYPAGGSELAALVSRLVVASPKLADAFLKAGGLANTEQKNAIGAGLGQAVSIINEKDPEAATAIAQLVAAANDKVIQTAFVASVGDGTAAFEGGLGRQGRGQGRAVGLGNGLGRGQGIGGGGGDPVSPSS